MLGGVIVVFGSLAVGRTYATVQTVERSFSVDVDFVKVRKILVRTDATKQIVAMTGDSQFIAQHWNTIGGGIDALRLRNMPWKLELHGTLEVRTRDAYIGQHVVSLDQDVTIEPDQVYSDVTLARPTERLLQYEMRVRFEKNPDGTTLVRQRLQQEILTDAPRFAHFLADRRVRQSAEKALINQEQAIRRVIEENRDKRWLLLSHGDDGHSHRDS